MFDVRGVCFFWDLRLCIYVRIREHLLELLKPFARSLPQEAPFEPPTSEVNPDGAVQASRLPKLGLLPGFEVGTRETGTEREIAKLFCFQFRVQLEDRGIASMFRKKR